MNPTNSAEHQSGPVIGPVIRTQGLTRHFTRHKKTVEAVRGLEVDAVEGAHLPEGFDEAAEGNRWGERMHPGTLPAV